MEKIDINAILSEETLLYDLPTYKKNSIKRAMLEFGKQLLKSTGKKLDLNESGIVTIMDLDISVLPTE